jgi:hypothetical protein
MLAAAGELGSPSDGDTPVTAGACDFAVVVDDDAGNVIENFQIRRGNAARPALSAAEHSVI